MNIWAISDLHLSFARPKPMDVFGEHWRDHATRVGRVWRRQVSPDDVVCLPGDLSWAMRLADVRGELDWLGKLPGRKILIKGNHDYWWSSVAKVRQELPSGAYAIQNDSVVLDGVAFGGARGWVDPNLDFQGLFPGLGRNGAGPALLHEIRGGDEDSRIYRRELLRLEASLRAMPSTAELRVALLHFPPSSPDMEETEVVRLLERYRVNIVVFGHLHGTGADTFANPYGTRSGVEYFLASADFVGFAPLQVART